MDYAACLADAEDNGLGIDGDPTAICDPNAFFFADDDDVDAPTTTTSSSSSSSSSPMRSNIREFLITRLHLPPPLSSYLASLKTTTVSYLASLFVFLLLLVSHYVAHQIGMATMRNDPMKHFVLATSSDKTVRADGTVEAKRGETEAMRKKRERMMQAERMKAQMAQLAMEAKMAAQARIARLEGAAAAEKMAKEGEEAAAAEKKEREEESEEIVRDHGRQYMMIKAGVPDGAILNSLMAEGVDDETERIEIVGKLRAVKAARAEAARTADEDAAKKAEEDIKREMEREEGAERMAKERLASMKRQRSAGSGVVKTSTPTGGGGGTSTSLLARSHSLPVPSDGGAELRRRMAGRGGGAYASSVSMSMSTPPAPTISSSAVTENGGGGSLVTAASSSGKSTISSSVFADPSVERANMLGQIGRGAGAGLKRASSSSSSSSSLKKVLMNGEVPFSTPVQRRPGNSTSIAQNKSPTNDGTPIYSNKSGGGPVDSVPIIPDVHGRIKRGGKDEEGEEDEEEEKKEYTTPKNATIPPTMPSTIPAHPVVADYSKIVEVVSKHGPESKDDISEDSPPPILVRISSSPDCDTLLPVNQCLDFSSPSMWDQRPSASDIQATITAVENAPDEAVEGRKVIDLSPGWLHSPAFEMALRNSNASWDRRPTSRDVMAKIRAVEMEEAKEEEEERAAAAAPTPLRRGTRASSGSRQQQHQTTVAEDSLGVTDQSSRQAPIYSTTLKRQASKGGRDDDEISELSEPTYLSLEQNAFKGRSIPQSLFVPQTTTNNFAAMSPMVSDVGLSPPNAFDRKRFATKDSIETLARMSERGELILPSMSNDSAGTEKEVAASINVGEETAKDAVVEETDEQKQRREKAEARVKKMEAIAARRNAGIDEDESSISGISKRHRMRRKKKVQLPSISQEEGSVKSDAPSSQKSDERSNAVKVETEEEKQRKKRAEARAKKLEAMSSLRNSGFVDDDTAVSGISRLHRIRRKKSALAAITPEDRERNDWKKSVYSSVLNAEQVKWQTSVYTHVINAEATRAKNVEAKRELDEQNLASQRRLENKKRLAKMARKFAARAEQFHKIRREGGADDDSSVVSGVSKIKRRRGRKSTMRQSLVTPLVEESAGEAVPIIDAPTEPAVITQEEIEKQERKQWCELVYVTALRAEQTQWKTSVYHHILKAEVERAKRIELQTLIERQLLTAEACREKARQVELRARKMERIAKFRQEDEGLGGGVENVAPADGEVGLVGLVTKSSSMKKMRDRRKKAAMKNASK
jgi:hypothetical protein